MVAWRPCGLCYCGSNQCPLVLTMPSSLTAFPFLVLRFNATLPQNNPLQSRSCWRRYRATMRTILIIIMAMLSSGCISADYKFGSYWVVDEKSSKLNNQAQTECARNKIETNAATSSSSQIIAPYFIPLFYLSGITDKEIIIKIESLACPELSIRSDKENDLAYTTHHLNSGYCNIHIPQPTRTEKITIQALNSQSDCEANTITLVKKGFFCIRQTQFGGSPSCEKTL